ncbi:MAG: alpha-hydroxy-acid oxidizing protein [Alphaproteobacteria bacterium]|nr:alpha-hydroxy-acid oxidizing protein [Alphaproteobacteria bacterium]
MSGVSSALNIEDLRKMAGRRLPSFLFDYVEYGHADGASVARNKAAFDKYQMLSRVLVKVVPPDTRRTVFGREYDLPFGISAVGGLGIFRPGADRFLAEVAREANIPFMLSGVSTESIETVARIAPDHVWFQLYPAREFALTERLIGQARNAGCEVLVVSVDYPIQNKSEVPQRSGVTPIGGIDWAKLPSIAGDLATHPRWLLEFLRSGGMPKMESWMPYAPAGSSPKDIAKYFASVWPPNLVWEDVERIRALWKGKLVLKGLMEPGDVSRAYEVGADAVSLSNHGGNKLNIVPATVDCLAPARDVAPEGSTLFLDGGIRRGSDVVKAAALGADFCFLGRAFLYGVAAGGRDGARRVVEIVRDDLSYTLAMLGIPDMYSVDPALLVTQA